MIMESALGTHGEGSFTRYVNSAGLFSVYATKPDGGGGPILLDNFFFDLIESGLVERS